jgi:integrase
VYASDPTRPTGSIKVAWQRARKRAGLKVRVHDLRHTGVSRMIKNKVPLPMIAKIVGWSASTTVRMAQRYGTFTPEEMRPALETISSGTEITPGYYSGGPPIESTVISGRRVKHGV